MEHCCGELGLTKDNVAFLSPMEDIPLASTMTRGTLEHLEPHVCVNLVQWYIDPIRDDMVICHDFSRDLSASDHKSEMEY